MNIAYSTKPPKLIYKLFKRKSLIVLLLLIFGSLSGATAYLTYYGQEVGNFVVGVTGDSSEVGLALSEDKTFAYSKPRLIGGALSDILPITYADVNKDLVLNSQTANYTSKEGNYMGYKFYLKNVGSTIVDVEYTLEISSSTHYVDRSIRAWVFRGDDDTVGMVYQKADEVNTVYEGYHDVEYFVDDSTILNKYLYNFAVGEVKEFVVIFWVEGQDPDCVDTGDYSILDGTIKFSMNFKVSENV